MPLFRRAARNIPKRRKIPLSHALLFHTADEYILHPACLVDKFQDFIQLFLLLLFGIALYRRCNALPKMPVQNPFFHTRQSPLDGVYLVQNIDAILAVLDHLLNPADLTFDTPQRNQIVLMARITLHAPFLSHPFSYYTPGGYSMFIE